MCLGLPTVLMGAVDSVSDVTIVHLSAVLFDRRCQSLLVLFPKLLLFRLPFGPSNRRFIPEFPHLLFAQLFVVLYLLLLSAALLLICQSLSKLLLFVSALL